ncbi:glycosyltransferase family 4 protein [Salinicoccus roseus]|uniref:glycosyltransferase family 4 protein n=1 Tax=Salinicoccus roseus TaxID=45670 RepID=UPI002300B252|nr:glycosyltransferase family 4 protein [Salinicoccus roseus]
MKPKIVQVTAIGLSQVKLLSKLNRTLVEQGYEVHAVCTEDEYTGQLKEEGIIFHPIKIDRSINPRRNMASLSSMIQLFNEIKPDVVHVHTPVAAALGRIAAKIAGVPNVIYTAHGFYFHEGMNKATYRLFFSIEKYIGRMFTDYIFTQSKEDYELSVKSDFLKTNNYLHISNGIDLNNQFNIDRIDNEEIEKLKEELKIQDDTIVFSFLGRLVREKGIAELLNAFSVLQKEYSNIKLLCMGSLLDSERDSSIGEEIERFENNDDIVFLGQVENPEYYYALSDVYILPSYREGMPRSIIEAMAMNNAIIATDIRGSREEVSQGENGLLVKVKSVTDLVQAMRTLIVKPETIKEMKKHGRNKALNEYDEEEVVNKQLKVFNKLLSR